MAHTLERYMRWSRRLLSILPELTVFVLGAFAVILSYRYGIGSLRQSGPGFFPAISGIALCLLAALLMLINQPSLAKHPPNMLASTITISVFIILFAVLIDYLGLLVAVLFPISWLALRDSRISAKVAASLVIAVAVFAWVIFIKLLGLHLRLIP